MKPLVCGHKSKHHSQAAGGSYQSQQTSTCQLPLFSVRSHLVVCYGPSDMSKAADRNMRDAYATFSCPVQTPVGTPEHAGWPSGGRLKRGCPGKRYMGQDLDYNTVIIYFTTDDLIRVFPAILREWRKGDCVSARGLFACQWMCVLTWAWARVCPGPLSCSALAVWECKILALDGRSHKVWSRSHISSTRWCSESAQRSGGEVVMALVCKGRWHASPPHHHLLHLTPCPSTRSPTPCLGSLGLGGGQGSRRQPLDSALRERSLGLLTQWHYLSSSLGYCSGEHFLSLCKHFLSLA